MESLKINLSELRQNPVKLSSHNAPKHRPIGRCLLSLGSVVPEFPLIFGWGWKGSGNFSLSENYTFCK